MIPAGLFQPESLAPDRQLATDTPVICIIYNRARLARKVVDRLRQIKPGRILIVVEPVAELGPRRSGSHCGWPSLG